MNWKGIPYEAIDVNPLTKAEISFSPSYRKVPIGMLLLFTSSYSRLLVLFNDRQLNDSSVIMDELIESLRVSGKLPANFKGSSDPEIARWLQFADKQLAVVLFPNITRNMLESWEAFGYINRVSHFGYFQKIILRVTGSVAMRLANSKIKKKYSIIDERESLLLAVNEWTTNGLNGKKFHGYSEPDLADVTIFGCLKSIESFATFAWLVNVAPKEFMIWFNRMGQVVVF